MVREPLQAEAARRQLLALDSYVGSFEAMVLAQMSSDLYLATNDSLEQVRQAALMNPRELLFTTTQLVLAHVNLASKLWERHAAGGPAAAADVSTDDIEALRHDHRRAVERLRDRCRALLQKRPAPGAPA